MNPVIELLLEIADKDPLPVAHTSSHWERYGKEIVIERRGGELILHGAGFTARSRTSFFGKLLYSTERLSYTTVTSGLRSYSFVWNEAKRLARDLRIDLTRHEWTSAVAFSVLADHFLEHDISPKKFVLIGDGDGFLGALILRCLSKTNIGMYAVDLPKMLVFQAHTHESANPRITMSVLAPYNNRQTDRQAGRQNITFVHPKYIELVPDEIDCAISFVSMQEMNPFSIASYFAFLRRRSTPRSRFYCVSRLQKELPGGEISSFFDYPWRAEDEVFIDGPCPYLTYFFDQCTYASGPRLLGMRVPFINCWDGASWHRLARLAPLS